MIYWDKVVGSHVINTFRNICYKWWGIDIQFYDEYGRCKSGCLALQNHFCLLMQSTTKKSVHCNQSYKRTLRGISKTQTPFLYRCYAGVRGAAVPIFANGKYVGAMIGSGIKLSNDKESSREMYTRNLTKLGFDRNEVKKGYSGLKTMDKRSEEYLLDLMSLVAKDVMFFYEMLKERDEAVKRQMELQDKAYNERYCGMIGISPAMKKTYSTLDVFQDSESPVLIDGESGTGKELTAAAIHYNSPRKDKMFVIQNCSTFSDTLLISELFGHEKGSFTGAIAEKKGLFEVADNGTIFLDEIADISIDTGAKLLRVLEDGTFYRMGGIEPKKVDVRLIVATNKDLKKQVELGLFRMDLYFRINTIHITMPPLRDRREDIVPLANYFLETYAGSRNVEAKHIDVDVVKELENYKWPGNVRELKNMIERMIMLSGNDKMIESEHVPTEITADAHPATSTCTGGRKEQKLKDALRSLEKELVKKELKNAAWNKTVASKALGISRASLNMKIEQYNILP